MAVTSFILRATLFLGIVHCQASSTPPPSDIASLSAATATAITAVSGCHIHGTTQFCIAGLDEYQVLATSTGTEEAPSQYTGCHSHGADELYCLTPDGGEVQLLAEGSTAGTGEEPSPKDSVNCHFHAGVEHCVGAGGEESGAASCERRARDYNIPLRIGLIFAILASSAIGSFGPVFLTSLTRLDPHHMIFTISKQFGTGVIISTAFVHLYTHATLMFANGCLGKLSYEATTSAIVMAGILIAFLVEYCGRRLVVWRQNKHSPTSSETGTMPENAHAKDVSPSVSHGQHGFGAIKAIDKLSVVVLEAGLVFHSVLIGVTLVVAGDNYLLTLFAVIFFHQMFEGIALGTMIARLPSSQATFSMKMIMSSCFAISTPLGMAIGTAVLSSFNGNDPSTIVVIGTLDAFSTGILVWVGMVEMWTEDWILGDLANAGMVKTGLSFFALTVGMLLMSVLGKWA